MSTENNHYIQTDISIYINSDKPYAKSSRLVSAAVYRVWGFEILRAFL